MRAKRFSKEKRNNLLVVVYFAIALLISLYNPFGGHTISDEMKMIFSFSGLLFSILAGFFIVSLWTRFTRIRGLISSEAASLENIYKFFELVSEKVVKNKRVAQKIDEYIIEAFDFGLHRYQEEMMEEYASLYDTLKNLKEGGEDDPTYGWILNIFDQFTKTRKEILTRGKDKLGFYHWTVLWLLSILLITIWLHIQFSGWLGIILGTIIIFAIATVLTIIYDLNNLNWGNEQINIEIYQRIYDVIGLPRYYPEEVLRRISVPERIKEYRVGILVDPETRERKIKKVKRD